MSCYFLGKLKKLLCLAFMHYGRVDFWSHVMQNLHIIALYPMQYSMFPVISYSKALFPFCPAFEPLVYFVCVSVEMHEV